MSPAKRPKLPLLQPHETNAGWAIEHENRDLGTLRPQRAALSGTRDAMAAAQDGAIAKADRIKEAAVQAMARSFFMAGTP